MHEWDDEWFKKNGSSLYKAIDYFTTFNRRYGRWFFFTKEKYGTMRLEFLWERTTLDNLLGRNLIFIHKPILHKISNIIDKPLRFLRITKLIYKYQRFIFNLATLRTCSQYPEVKEEIMYESEFDELLYNWVKKKVGYKCSWVTCGDIGSDTYE